MVPEPARRMRALQLSRGSLVSAPLRFGATVAPRLLLFKECIRTISCQAESLLHQKSRKRASARRLLQWRQPLGSILKSESPVERHILDYLSANPSAQDTLRGIVEWWLLKQRIQESLSEVEAAVNRLVTKGQLIAEAGPDGLIRYRSPRREGTPPSRDS